MDEAGTAARKLKALREEAGLSVGEVAKAIGKRKSSYQYYEDEFKKERLPPELVGDLIPVFEAARLAGARERLLELSLPTVTRGGLGKAGEAHRSQAWMRVKALADAAQAGEPGTLPPAMPGVVKVRGEVEAGAWREAYEWPESEWLSLPLPPGPHNINDLFALKVRGPSMDLVYPDGSYVVCKPLWKVGRQPRSGERVVVERRRAGLVEATIKELEIQRDGRVMLWPRSSSPAYQAPVELTGGSLSGWGLADGAATFLHEGLAESGMEIAVTALVVGKFGWE